MDTPRNIPVAPTSVIFRRAMMGHNTVLGSLVPYGRVDLIMDRTKQILPIPVAQLPFDPPHPKGPGQACRWIWFPQTANITEQDRTLPWPQGSAIAFAEPLPFNQAIEQRVGEVYEKAKGSNKRVALVLDNPTVGEMVMFNAFKNSGRDFDIIINEKKALSDDTWYVNNVIASGCGVTTMPSADMDARAATLLNAAATHILVFADMDYIVGVPEQYMLDDAGLTDEMLDEGFDTLLETLSGQPKQVVQDAMGLCPHTISTVRELLWWFAYMFKHQPEQVLIGALVNGIHRDNFMHFFDTFNMMKLAMDEPFGTKFSDDNMFMSWLKSQDVNIQEMNDYHSNILSTWTHIDTKGRFQNNIQVININWEQFDTVKFNDSVSYRT